MCQLLHSIYHSWMCMHVFSVWARSICIYMLTCSCEGYYIDYTKRTLSKRILEHYLKWNLKGECKTINSSKQEHFINSDHVILPASFFKIICTLTHVVSKPTQSKYCLLKNFKHVSSSRLNFVCSLISISLTPLTFCFFIVYISMSYYYPFITYNHHAIVIVMFMFFITSSIYF